MKKLTLSEIAQACNGTLTQPQYGDLTIASITTDSRKATESCLFIPLKGERVDGHDFIQQTFEAGVTCTLSEKEIETDKPVIMVESCYQAIKDIAEYYRSLFNIPVVGVSGSVGKTSTKEVIASTLAEKYNVLKTEGNFNNEIGLPLTILKIRDHHEIAVIEMGISHFGDMKPLGIIANPDICVITNIGYCHLEHLKDRDGVLKEKTSMFDYAKENDCDVVEKTIWSSDESYNNYEPAIEFKEVWKK